MKSNWAVLVLLFLLSSVVQAANPELSPVAYVNPFIGTANSVRPSKWESNGGTYPGAALPFGMVQATPEGYRYAEPHINWFSFINHTSGYPSGSSGHVYIMPFFGDIKNGQKNFGSGISHDNESAQPGYYAVFLQDMQIHAELTVAPHSGFCRFQFPANNKTKIIFSDFSEIGVFGENEIIGNRGDYFFYIKINQPIQNSKQLDDFFYIELPPNENRTVLLKIGFSKNGASQAKENLLAEIPDWDFERTKNQALVAWNDQLSLFKITGGTKEQKMIFYTSVYHSLLDPHLETDVDQEPRYSQLSPWDTFRSKHPLLTLLWPHQQLNMIKSVLDRYKQTGQLPAGPMTGNHNIAVIVDSYFKGITNFDIECAYEAMRKALLQPPFARPDIDIYKQYGYVPAEQSYSVTKTLEYAYNDWALAQLAKKLGWTDDADTLLKRAFSYQHILNPDTKFMQAKTKAGEWTEEGFREGDPWTYSWFVPHDVQGLINLMGGNKKFSDKLNLCFRENHYVHDNEPPLHYAYLFNYAGTPWLTQKWVDAVRERNYTTEPGGLPGNDDLGALSAWYVLSAMGIYPVCPGRPIYDLGVPLFDEIKVRLPNGKFLTIAAKEKSAGNKYVSSVELNGQVLDRLWLRHDEIVNGGQLVFVISPEPNKGSNQQAAASMTIGKPNFKILKFSINKTTVKANETFSAETLIENTGNAPGTFDFQLAVDSKHLKSESVIIDPGAQTSVNTKIKLYTPGEHNVGISSKFQQRVMVQAVKPTFVFSDFKIPNPPVVELGKTVQFDLSVKNIGSYEGNAKAQLLLNGEIIKQEIQLAPGEEKSVYIKKVFQNTGIVNVTMNDLAPQKLRVYRPGEKPDSIYMAAQYQPVVVYGFDEAMCTQVKDLSGKGNNGNVINNVKWVPGLLGSAIQTNALEQNFIEIPDSESMQKIAESKTLSMMAWIYPMEEKNFADFFTQGDWNVLQVRASNTAVNFYTGGYQRGEAYGTVEGNWNRNWHHVAGVTEGNLQKLYIDGELTAEKEIELVGKDGKVNPIGNADVHWNIGRNAQNPERFFNGYIDDMRIYVEPVPQKEIRKIMLNDIGR